MKESNIRDKFTQSVKSEGGDVSNHEDKFTFGVPDSSYGLSQINGWVEHKYIGSWPVRPSTKIKIGLRKDQVFWMEKRQKTGGRCFILIGVESEIFLFSGDLVRELYSGIIKKQFYEMSLAVWNKQIDTKQLKLLLCG